MRQASAQVMASQKQLEAKYRQAQATADDWYRRAQLALAKGDEELAREALTRRASYSSSADGIASQVTQQKEAVDKLIASTRLLEQKMAEARSKKDTLKARAASARTSKQVSEMVGNLSTSSALSAFERMESKVLAMESEADAVAQLAAPDAVSAKFAALESGGSVDDELAAMRKALAGGARAAGELPPARKARPRGGKGGARGRVSRPRVLTAARVCVSPPHPPTLCAQVTDAIEGELEALRAKAKRDGY